MAVFPEAESLVITVLDGPMASTPLMADKPAGVIELQGRALPYRGLAFEGEQRVKTRYYAGNPVATQQVMGPTEAPSSMTGTWKDKFLGDGVAMSLYLLFDQLRRQGPQVRLTWAGIERTGILRRFKGTFDNTQDIGWEAMWEWASQGETMAPVISSTTVQNPREGLRALFDDSTAVVDGVGAFSQSAVGRLVGFPDAVRTKLDEASNQIIGYTQNLADAVNVVTTIEGLPREVLERAIAISRALATSLRQVEDGLLDPSLDLGDPGESGAWVGTRALDFNVADDPLGLLVYLGDKLDLLDSTQRALETCLSTSDALEAQLFPEVIAEERPPAGSDLRDLARKYYGDADAWWVIANYNGLDSSAVPPLPAGPSDNPARTIKIPRRQTGALGDLRRAC